MFHLVTISKTTLCDARPIQNAGQPLKGALALPDVCEAAVGSTRVPGRTAALFERQSVSVSVSFKDRQRVCVCVIERRCGGDVFVSAGPVCALLIESFGCEV